MRRGFTFCIVLVLCSLLLADDVITKSDGKKVLLKDNKTWEYVEETRQDQNIIDESTAQTQSEMITSPADENTTAGHSIAGSESIQSEEQRSLIRIGIIVISALVFIIAGILIYFLVIVPLKKKKYVNQAFEIIMSDRKDQLFEAENLLEKALSMGLKGTSFDNAQFGLAYIKSVNEKYTDALSDINRIKTDDEHSVFFKLWLNLKAKEYMACYKVYETNKPLVQNNEDAKKLASIACLHMGMNKWRERNIEEACRYFNIVKELEVLKDEVPDTISTYPITLGIASLYEKNYDEAKGHFEKALQQASEEDYWTFPAELGLLLCQWIQIDYPDIDKDLAGIIERMNAERDQHELYLTPVSDQQKKSEKEDEELDEDEQDEDRTQKMTEDGLLYRNVALWFAVSRLYLWMLREKHSNLPGNERKILDERLQIVTKLDPEMPDPNLIEGLIDYYFNYDNKRKEAIEKLDKTGVKVPEVEILVKKEKKLFDAETKVAERFYALASDYLKDKTVPKSIRQDFKKKMEKFDKFKKLSKGKSIVIDDDEVDLSVQDLHMRGQILGKRINDIIMPKLNKENDIDRINEFKKMIDTINETSKLITEQASDLEKDEHQLMLNTGEFLLQEEETNE